CIDKSSSAELTEAINSMFRWYQKAAACCAYLDDATLGSESACDDTIEDLLRWSRWFTRGWTLQELIAPNEVHFYDSLWKPMGTRTALGTCIADITSINSEILTTPRATARTSIHSLLSEKSVARRMAWTAHRKTTRPEDIAYCLLGLFDIHMPLIYGEGTKKAFARLQIEILRDSTDQSILAW
ncbi:HET-domain-containing protein, partial [Bimuria novae-zelandiae CBS 107.79]